MSREFDTIVVYWPTKKITHKFMQRVISEEKSKLHSLKKNFMSLLNNNKTRGFTSNNIIPRKLGGFLRKNTVSQKNCWH